MAKSKKKKKTKVKKAGIFKIVLTGREKLLLLTCAVIGFVATMIIFLLN